MSWPALFVLAAAAYVLKALGPVLGPRHEPGPNLARILELLPVPLLSALIVVQTVDAGERIVLDARLAAIGVAGVLVWRRAPFVVVVVAAAATAALLRTL
jgi:branched-subunit amino acid transport protein